MVGLLELAYYLVHPSEFRSIIQWKMWHDPVHERDESMECPELKECFVYLKLTSRSFVAVILELHPELMVPVALFYLVLRGLDTIEDDMTIPVERKVPLLRGFDDIIEKDGWTFTENGPNEKDRELLVHFNVVIHELKKIKPEYHAIIKDITKKMGNGMADYIENSEHNLHGVNTVKDYELYCHYVAGLVGEGLTKLFVEAKLANPALLNRPDLHESMGQLLQQVNIIRDIREDRDDKRYFWPREIWSKHVEKFDDLFDPKNKEKALACSSEMVLNALQKADDCLFYLAGIRDQSVFNFCAIPQTMAMATLERCFQNPDLFQKNVKITKGQACGLMIKSTQNLHLVCEVFKEYARKIHRRNNPTDPNFLNISVACGQIEVFIESIFPTQTARTLQEKADAAAAAVKPDLTPAQVERKKIEDAAARKDMFIVIGLVVGLLLLLTMSMVFVAWMLGAQFDVAWEQIRMGPVGVHGTPEEKAAASARRIFKDRDEL